MGEGKIGSETEGPGNQLGQIRLERQRHKNGPRAESGRRRIQQVGSGKCRQGNGKAVRHRLAITHNGEHKRPKPSQNARLLRETTARQYARRKLSIQK